jgi:outer membrane biosynthesis protein TonB
MTIVDQLDLQGENTDILAGAVLEAERHEELKKLEWIIERKDVEMPFNISKMPWARGGEDDRLFRKSLAGSLLIALFLGLMLPLIDLPIPDRWAVVEVPERFARMVREQRPPPPPPKAVEETKPTETDELVPAEELAENVSPEPEKAAPDPKPSPGTGSKGILAFRDSFSGLAKTKTADLLGSKARISNSGKTASGMPERSLVTSQAPGSSGGINLAGLSRDVGGGSGQGMDGVQVVQATSSIGTGVGGSDRPLSGGRTAGRTDEEIQIVFDRHKSALYRLYNRELRRNPTLKGQMILRMTIEADGSVSLCEVTSTDLKSPTLSAQVVARVKTFDFGAKEDISAVTFLYPIDFLPAL